MTIQGQDEQDCAGLFRLQELAKIAFLSVAIVQVLYHRLIFLSGRCSVALSLFKVALALTLSVAEALQPFFTATLLRATSIAAIGKNSKYAHKIGFGLSERDFGLFNGSGHVSVHFLSWIPEATRLRFSLVGNCAQPGECIFHHIFRYSLDTLCLSCFQVQHANLIDQSYTLRLRTGTAQGRCEACMPCEVAALRYWRNQDHAQRVERACGQH